MTKKYHPLKKNKTNKYTNKHFRFWHRKLGVLSVLFVIMLSITGILINHSHTLSLDNKKVTFAWLLENYGISAPSSITVFQTDPLIASSDNLIWIKDFPPIEADQTISAIISFNEFYIAITPSQLYLISQQGKLLEKQDSTLGLPQNIEKIGQDGHLWLKTANGYFTTDRDLIEWTKASPLRTIPWVEPRLTSQATNEIERISLKSRSEHLTWERVLLDIHSGRFFGPLGPWFMDLVAIALIIMSLTGLYLWQTTKKRKPKKHHYS